LDFGPSSSCAIADSSHTLASDNLDEMEMRAAVLAISLILGALPLTGGAQVVSEQSQAMAGTYAGLNLGRSSYTLRNPSGPVTDDFCPAGAYDCRHNPNGWKLYAGYMISPYFGFEGTGYWMGDAHAKFDLGGGNIQKNVISISGYALSAVGAVPLGPVRLNGRIGWAASTATRKDDINGANIGRSSTSRGEPLFGAGASVQVWRGMFVSIDWDRARAETDVGEKFQADMFSAGIGWRF
jgi:hypothetical protein